LGYFDEKPLSTEERMKYVKEILTKFDFDTDLEIGYQLGFTPEYFDAMYAIGVKYYENNRLDDAVKIFYQLIALQPSAFRNYKGMGACLQAKEDYDHAIGVYTSGVALAMMDAEFHFYVGQCQFLKKDFAEAEKTLTFANKICEKYPEKWGHIAGHAKELHARAKERTAH
jgi:tetratricopeptide (TPR) repeat protein